MNPSSTHSRLSPGWLVATLSLVVWAGISCGQADAPSPARLPEHRVGREAGGKLGQPLAERAPEEAGTGAGFWPQYHGPRRDNLSDEEGLLEAWPSAGPRLAWKSDECGHGFATVSVADGRIYTSGDFRAVQMVIALDLDGRLLWRRSNGPSWRGATPGSRSTPTFDEGRLYHLGSSGRLAAFRAASGEELWSVDVAEAFGARSPLWALSESVLVEGDRVLCVPGGSRGRIVALNKKTGATIWANTEIEERAAYCSPLAVTHGGRRVMITLMQDSVVALDVATGELLWSHAHETPYNVNVTTPLYRDGRVFVTGGYGQGGHLLEIASDGRSVVRRWQAPELDNCHGGVILVGGHFYGSGCRRNKKGLVCVDEESGAVTWRAPQLGKVSPVYADGRIYCVSNKGQVSLLAPDAERCRVISQFDLPGESEEETLAHPVVCGGRLYVRRSSELFAFEVRAKPPHR